MAYTVGFIGLGKMGKGLVLHLLENNINVVVYNRTREVTDAFRTQITEPNDQKRLTVAPTINELVQKLQAPRIIWLMVPNGAPVDEVIDGLTAAGVTTGDTIIDGGSCFYKDTVRRAEALAAKGVQYVDSGTSGGLDGARTGASLMLGGDEATVKGLDWLWNAIAVKGGWNYFGPSGAGHFVKMVHNGIEYGIDQALGEGVEILAKGPYHIDLAKVAATWQNGSIIRSYLVELLARALSKDPTLESFTGKVGGGETGGWTLAAAREFGVAAPVIENAIAARQQSQSRPTTSSKVVSALRREYGGHGEAK